ncbi:MAG: hypothetical protein WB444_03575 [Gallionella sp.]
MQLDALAGVCWQNSHSDAAILPLAAFETNPVQLRMDCACFERERQLRTARDSSQLIMLAVGFGGQRMMKAGGFKKHPQRRQPFESAGAIGIEIGCACGQGRMPQAVRNVERMKYLRLQRECPTNPSFH